ncbi:MULTISPECIES: rhomboid family intramembrane serine protease [Paraburkholderia]|uniref:rhomboid family intramembrane serine protease n=1 Tax=Paraburkholderia TaxID=1822464 RepID=UPI002254B0FF|nr:MULTISPECIES: rhomboid family intramembrane serine protease [Paraburkholderia]MCX4161130.1 rhomboid family intramembrane serine protease [Paraburkholderia megapolitana]MDN7156626.1 rhomboid family intramembrane serine protease [Paraburkholderia sp. CHISQ3]MDQ6493671.1 rhomboid family intramembrane serine protease [Paraburkholderia megapolitana]
MTRVTAPRSNTTVSIASLKPRAVLLVCFVGSMWMVWAVSAALPFLNLAQYGVVPRTFRGLVGILFAPWLHANLAHLMANTGALVVLGWLCMWPRIAEFWQATLAGMLGAGATAWLLGAPDTVHIGASGLVFGYAGYLVARGWYTHSVLSIVVALFVAGVYGVSVLSGVLPLTPGISWQSHLGGALGGILAARIAARVRRSG